MDTITFSMVSKQTIWIKFDTIACIGLVLVATQPFDLVLYTDKKVSVLRYQIVFAFENFFCFHLVGIVLHYVRNYIH